MKIISLESQTVSLDGESELLLDTMDEVLSSNDKLMEYDKQCDKLVDDMRLLSEIRDNIKTHGITPSIESMFGESLQHAGIDLSDADITCEGIVDTIKKVARAIWKFILKIVAAIKDFFAKHFGTFQNHAKALKTRQKEMTGANRKVIKFYDKKNTEVTVSKSCLSGELIVLMFNDADSAPGIVKILADELEHAETGNEVESPENSYVEVSSERSDDGIYTYTVTSNIDDFMDTDKKVSEIVMGETIAQKHEVYLHMLDVAKTIATKLGAGKLYSTLHKKYDKIDKKAEKNAKAADYSESARIEAANVRNGLKAINKAIKIQLELISSGMATLLAVPIMKPDNNQQQIVD